VRFSILIVVLAVAILVVVLVVAIFATIVVLTTVAIFFIFMIIILIPKLLVCVQRVVAAVWLHDYRRETSGVCGDILGSELTGFLVFEPGTQQLFWLSCPDRNVHEDPVSHLQREVREHQRLLVGHCECDWVR
jgi:hypothetical protein